MSRMLFGWNSAKLSAQSPPCSRKALPAATAAKRSLSRRASPAKTRGGKRCNVSDAGECGFVGITRDLTDRQAAPAVRGPIFYHVTVSRGWRPLHHRRHSDHGGHETRKPPRWGGFGKTRERDPRPPSYTGSTKIARSSRGREGP